MAASDPLHRFVEKHGYAFEELTALPDEGSARRYWRAGTERAADGPLGAGAVRAEVDGHSGTKVGGGASADHANAESKSVILCVDLPFQEASSDFIQITRFLKSVGAAVPGIIDFDERGWFLIEDAGVESLDTLYKRDRSAGETAYVAAMDELARWHAFSARSPVAGRSFDFDKLWWEMEFLFARLDSLSEILQTDLRPSFELKMFLRGVCEHLGSAVPKVFTHRDFHARNIMIPDASHPERVVFIDFQDARMGLPWYDLASLLYDPYSDLSLDQRRQWLDYYRSITGRKAGEDGNRYYLQALQRIFKALGSYLFLAFEKEKPSYVDSIDPALRRLEEIAMLGHFPDSVFLFVRDLRTIHLSALKDLAARTAGRSAGPNEKP